MNLPFQNQSQSATSQVPEPVLGNYFVAAYPPFSNWNTDAVARLRHLLHSPAPAAAAPLGLYVHVPFCDQRCDYCYYKSYDDRNTEVDSYLKWMAREWGIYGEKPFVAGRKPEVVYIGGGSPSLLSVPRLRRLLGDLQQVADWGAAREVSFECAPRTTTRQKLELLRDSGVTRLSMGVQQFDNRVLEANGRVHMVEDVAKAWSAICEVGFPVRNLDLMVGMVGETPQTFSQSVERIIDMGPESVTIYQMEIPSNTPLARCIEGGEERVEIATWAEKRQRLSDGIDRLKQAGYHIATAYAMVKDPVRHRFQYMHEQYRGMDLVGVGASAFSYVGGIHYQNHVSLDSYGAALRQAMLPVSRGYVLSGEEQLIRQFVLQLKLGRVTTAWFEQVFGVDVLKRFSRPLALLSQAGWLRVVDGAVLLTREGLLRVDRLIPAFYPPSHRGRPYW